MNSKFDFFMAYVWAPFTIGLLSGYYVPNLWFSLPFTVVFTLVWLVLYDNFIKNG